MISSRSLPVVQPRLRSERNLGRGLGGGGHIFMILPSSSNQSKIGRGLDDGCSWVSITHLARFKGNLASNIKKFNPLMFCVEVRIA
jgi:hypothetical protein